jgi:hypothetical protein
LPVDEHQNYFLAYRLTKKNPSAHSLKIFFFFLYTDRWIVAEKGEREREILRLVLIYYEVE